MTYRVLKVRAVPRAPFGEFKMVKWKTMILEYFIATPGVKDTALTPVNIMKRGAPAAAVKNEHHLNEPVRTKSSKTTL